MPAPTAGLQTLYGLVYGSNKVTNYSCLNLEELKAHIAAEWEVYQLLDALDIDMEQLVEILEAQIEDRAEELERVL